MNKTTLYLFSLSLLTSYSTAHAMEHPEEHKNAPQLFLGYDSFFNDLKNDWKNRTLNTQDSNDWKNRTLNTQDSTDDIMKEIMEELQHFVFDQDTETPFIAQEKEIKTPQRQIPPVKGQEIPLFQKGLSIEEPSLSQEIFPVTSYYFIPEEKDKKLVNPEKNAQRESINRRKGTALQVLGFGENTKDVVIMDLKTIKGSAPFIGYK